MTSYSGRTLVVILSTHRSGSSLTAQLLQRLGMSLGPFDLIGPLESNKHGHFEPVPVNHFDIELQRRALGFDGDMPYSEATLCRFLESDGRWNADPLISDADLAFGQELLRKLVGSGTVSGLKDPRILLLWPYWSRVLGRFPGLRVVLLTLVRSPHEVAMSMFMRGKGSCTYHDALDVTAVNLRRLQEIRKTWPDEQVLVRFDPRWYAKDVQLAAKVCGLAWDEAVFHEVLDPSAKHYDPTRVEHEGQRVFDELTSLGQPGGAAQSALFLARDAAAREKLMQIALQSQQQQMQTAAQEHAARAEVLATRCTKLEQGVGSLGANLYALAEKCTTLSEHVYEQFGQLLAQCCQLQDQYRQLQDQHRQLSDQFQHQQLALAALEQRWEAVENHPLYRAARRLRSVSHRLRGTDHRPKAA